LVELKINSGEEVMALKEGTSSVHVFLVVLTFRLMERAHTVEIAGLDVSVVNWYDTVGSELIGKAG
jgi:hypothetical protein